MRVRKTNDLTLITVNDIKQYIYCPRIIYYYYIMPVRGKATYKMEVGHSSQQATEALEIRRGFKRYNLTEGRRIFNKQLFSSALGLSGKLDMIIQSGNCYYPVDFKYSTERVHLNYIMQLGAYSLLLEESYSCKVDQGFICFIPNKSLKRIAITEEIKSGLLDIISQIRGIITNEEIPEQAKNRNRCQDCEYINYCNDVW